LDSGPLRFVATLGAFSRISPTNRIRIRPKPALIETMEPNPFGAENYVLKVL